MEDFAIAVTRTLQSGRTRCCLTRMFIVVVSCWPLLRLDCTSCYRRALPRAIARIIFSFVLEFVRSPVCYRVDWALRFLFFSGVYAYIVVAVGAQPSVLCLGLSIRHTFARDFRLGGVCIYAPTCACAFTHTGTQPYIHTVLRNIRALIRNAHSTKHAYVPLTSRSHGRLQQILIRHAMTRMLDNRCWSPFRRPPKAAAIMANLVPPQPREIMRAWDLLGIYLWSRSKSQGFIYLP